MEHLQIQVYHLRNILYHPRKRVIILPLRSRVPPQKPFLLFPFITSHSLQTGLQRLTHQNLHTCVSGSGNYRVNSMLLI